MYIYSAPDIVLAWNDIVLVYWNEPQALLAYQFYTL